MKPTLIRAVMVIAGAAMVSCAGPLDRRSHEAWHRIDRERYHGQLLMPPAASDGSTDEALPEDAALDDYIRYAMQHNPALQAAFYGWRAALERVPQARALPDPQLSLGIVIDEIDRDSRYMGERYAIEQMFPWFGTLEARGQVAMEAALAEAQRYEAQRLSLIERVTEAYTEYVWVHRAAAIARENRELVRQLEEVTRAMFRAGSVSQADVTRAQVEFGRLDDQVRSLEDLMGPTVAMLNAAMGRAAHAPLPPVQPTMQALEAVRVPELDDARLLAAAQRFNPSLAAARHAAAQQREAIALARKEGRPSFMVGVEYARDGSARMAMMDRGGSDMVMPMVSISVPLWREKYDAAVREAMANFSRATRQIQDETSTMHADLKRVLYDLRDAQRKVELYGGTLLPLARQSLATSQAAYRAAEAGFADVIDAQRVLLEFELAYERAVVQRVQAVARAQRLIGRPLDALMDETIKDDAP